MAPPFCFCCPEFKLCCMIYKWGARLNCYTAENLTVIQPRILLPIGNPFRHKKGSMLLGNLRRRLG